MTKTEEKLDDKVLEYRKRHKKCKYCKHLKYISHFGIGVDYHLCKAKDKIIKDLMPDMRELPRLFCSCYEVKQTK